MGEDIKPTALLTRTYEPIPETVFSLKQPFSLLLSQRTTASRFLLLFVSVKVSGLEISSQEGGKMSPQNDLHDLRDRVRNEIVPLIEKKGFLTERDIGTIWPEEQISELVSTQALGFPPRTSEELQKTFLKERLKIISILIKMNHLRWDSFYELYCNTSHKRVDTSLPFEKAALQAFLGPADIYVFYRDQWYFCPETIYEKQELQVFKRDAKLPFLKGYSKRLGEGGGMSKKVTEEVIPMGYYVDSIGRKNKVRMVENGVLPHVLTNGLSRAPESLRKRSSTRQSIGWKYETSTSYETALQARSVL